MSDPEVKSTSGPELVEPAGGYRVLARKYRPQTFDQLIGQDATASIQGISVITPAAHRASMEGANPTVGSQVSLTNTTASLSAIMLNSGNTMRGIALSNVTSTGTAIIRSSFGTLTVSETSVGQMAAPESDR